MDWVTERTEPRQMPALFEDPEDEEVDQLGHEASEEDESDHENFSTHESETEQELSDGETDNSTDSPKDDVLLGKDSTLWHKSAFGSDGLGVSMENTHVLKYVESPLDSWSIFFSFVDLIVENTNICIRKQQTLNKDVSSANTTNPMEIRALLGLLYLSGLYKPHQAPISEFWATDGTGIPIFPPTMSYNRFKFLMQCLRFDNVETRSERRKYDKLAAVREILDQFNDNCAENYNVGPTVTVDEILKPFRGRCSFKQHMPNKPAKYGIKVLSVVDAKTLYTSRLEIYCNQQPPGPYNLSNEPSEIIKRLTNHLQNAGRNITADNWFTSYPLAMDLLKSKTTLVGAIKKNSQELPPSFSISKNRTLKSTMFGFRKDVTILSYIPKKYECVLLLSTMHHSGVILDGGQKLPEIKAFYDSTKGAVDTTDRFCTSNSLARCAQSWPLVVFFTLLDLAALNGHVVLNSTDKPTVKYKGHKQYIRELGLSLIKPYSTHKSTLPSLDTNPKISWKKRANENQTDTEPAAKKKQPNRRRRCKLCPSQQDRKTQTVCNVCQRYICGRHIVHVCERCFESTHFPINCVEVANEPITCDSD